MQEANKARLIEQLLDLFEEQSTVVNPDPGKLRLRIGEVIQESLVNTQEVDSRRVTMLLSDLRGFTQMSEKYTAMEMVDVLNRYFARMSEIIIRHGGTIDKFMGDSIMALFGAPIQRPNDLETALACAIEMQLAMADINAVNLSHGMGPLYMGIGINTGNVVVGHLGSPLHSEYTVIGEQVNLASRVEAHSLRGQILLSENSYLLARDFIEIGDINEVKIKGKKGMVRMYELLGTRRPHPLKAPEREVRNSPRVQVEMPFTFQLLRGKTVLPQKITGSVIDVSYGGMSVISPVPVEAFKDIKIALSRSLMGSDLAEIYAKVLRVTPVSDGYECRIEFTAIDSTDSLVIKEFVDGIVEMNRQ